MKKAKDVRNDFWLELGPAAAWNGMQAHETAQKNGDASPDGRLHGFTGAEQGTIYQPAGQDTNCGCGKEGCSCPDGRGHGQLPDVNSDSVPPEIPPAPPETWPGL